MVSSSNQGKDVNISSCACFAERKQGLVSLEFCKNLSHCKQMTEPTWLAIDGVLVDTLVVLGSISIMILDLHLAVGNTSQSGLAWTV